MVYGCPFIRMACFHNPLVESLIIDLKYDRYFFYFEIDFDKEIMDVFGSFHSVKILDTFKKELI